ncbi:MAG TPA: hypothetical protein VGK58_00975 [Lacipirellulaceae bacterium]
MPESTEPSRAEISLPRFQFSLRAQMILVTAVAIALGLFVVVGWPLVWVLFHGVMYCLVPTPLVILALFGRGELRIFSIGALVPWISVWGQSSPLFVMLYNQNFRGPQILGWLVASTVFMLVAGAACGAIAVLTMRAVARIRGHSEGMRMRTD